MEFTRRVKGAETFLHYPCDEGDIIPYQVEMINRSDQKSLVGLEMTSGTLAYRITSYLPLDMYFRGLKQNINEIKSLFVDLVKAIEDLEHYLLDLDLLVIDKSKVYYSLSDQQVKLLYLPRRHLSPGNQQGRIKRLFLSLMYDYMSFESLSKCQDFVNHLQNEQMDIFALSHFLQGEDHQVLSEKKSWLKRLFPKKNQEAVKGVGFEPGEETLILKVNQEPYLLIGDRKIDLYKPSILVGRSPDLNDYSVPEALTMGRVHAEFKREEDQVFVIDLNTKNGTYINGKRIESQKTYLLHEGDGIEMGGQVVKFHSS